MPENKVEDELNRKKRTAINRNESTIITTAENENDIYSEKVFDFEEFVGSSSNKNAIKIRYLKEYGITDDIIVSTYKDMAGNIETKDTATNLLYNIFKRLAIQISLQPNGIVIDLDTGKMDPVASFAQAVETGIYAQSSVITESTEDFLVELGIDFANLYKEISKEDIEEYIFLVNNFDYRFIDKKEVEFDIDNFLNKDVSELNFSDNLKAFIQEQKNLIANSPYENIMHLFEITKIEIEVERTKGTPLYHERLKERKEFYEQHKDYIGKVPVRNNDDTINYEEIERFEEFRETYQIQYILSQIDEFKNAQKEGKVGELPKEAKQNIIMGIVSGLKYSKKQSPEFKEIVQDCEKILGEFCPGIDLNNKDSLKTKKQIAEFAKKEMGFKGERDVLDYTILAEFAYRQVKSTMNEFIITNRDVFKNGVDFDGVNISENLMYDSPVRNFFVGSEINFSENDENFYNELYQTFTINSWLESKEEAIQARYLILSSLKENYAEQFDGNYANTKKFERQIQDMEKKFGPISINENSKIKSDSVNVFIQSFINAGLTKYYTRDAFNFQNGMKYENLNRKEKREYIVNTVLGLKYLKEGQDFVISKMALRRLEMMNTENEKFVEFDKEGNPIINEELLLEEFGKVTKGRCENFKQIEDISERMKVTYLLKKLKEYTDLDAQYFLKLDDPNDYERSMEQIEDIRIKSNTERINGTYGERKQQEPVETSKNEEAPIASIELDEAIESGVAEWEEMNTGMTQNSIYEPRTDEQYEENSTRLNENAPELNLEHMNVSEPEYLRNKDKNAEEKGFFGYVKKVFNRIKGFFTGEKILAIGSGSQPITPVNNTIEEESKKEEAKKNNSLDYLKTDKNLKEQQEYSKMIQEEAAQRRMQTSKSNGEPQKKAVEDEIVI